MPNHNKHTSEPSHVMRTEVSIHDFVNAETQPMLEAGLIAKQLKAAIANEDLTRPSNWQKINVLLQHNRHHSLDHPTKQEVANAAFNAVAGGTTITRDLYAVAEMVADPVRDREKIHDLRIKRREQMALETVEKCKDRSDGRAKNKGLNYVLRMDGYPAVSAKTIAKAMEVLAPNGNGVMFDTLHRHDLENLPENRMTVADRIPALELAIMNRQHAKVDLMLHPRQQNDLHPKNTRDITDQLEEHIQRKPELLAAFNSLGQDALYPRLVPLDPIAVGEKKPSPFASVIESASNKGKHFHVIIKKNTDPERVQNLLNKHIPNFYDFHVGYNAHTRTFNIPANRIPEPIKEQFKKTTPPEHQTMRK